MDHRVYLEKALREITVKDAGEETKLVTAINAVRELADHAEKEGLLAIDADVNARDAVNEEEVPLMKYLRSLIMMVVDGMDPELIREIGYNRLVGSGAVGYEALLRILYVEGALSIQAAEKEHIIAMKLSAMLPDRMLEAYKDACEDREEPDGELAYFCGELPRKLFRKKEEAAEADGGDSLEKLILRTRRQP